MGNRTVAPHLICSSTGSIIGVCGILAVYAMIEDLLRHLHSRLLALLRQKNC